MCVVKCIDGVLIVRMPQKNCIPEKEESVECSSGMEGKTYSRRRIKMKKMSLFMVLAVVLVAGVARADLVARYEFEGNFNDSSGNGHTGTPMGGAAIVDWAPMPQTGVLSLPGNGAPRNDGVDLGTDPAFSLSTAFTLMAWIKPNTLEHNGTYDGTPIVSKYGNVDGSGQPMREYYFHFTSTGALKICVRRMDNPVGDNKLLSGDGYVEVDVWHHVAATYEYVTNGTSILKLFADGVEVASMDTVLGPTDIHPAQNARIGYWNWEANYQEFGGQMDDVRFYDNAMTETEIRGMVVPEPMTMMLLSLGGLVLYRRRRA